MTVTVLYFVTARYADWDAMAFPKTQKYNSLKGSLPEARKDLVLRPTDGPTRVWSKLCACTLLSALSILVAVCHSLVRIAGERQNGDKNIYL